MQFPAFQLLWVICGNSGILTIESIRSDWSIFQRKSRTLFQRTICFMQEMFNSAISRLDKWRKILKFVFSSAFLESWNLVWRVSWLSNSELVCWVFSWEQSRKCATNWKVRGSFAFHPSTKGSRGSFHTSACTLALETWGIWRGQVSTMSSYYSNLRNSSFSLFCLALLVLQFARILVTEN